MRRGILIAVILTVTIGSLFIPMKCLVIDKVLNQQTILSFKQEPHTAFMMKWIHSVELEPWEEHFVIDKHDDIVLVKTRFKAFGAGVPDAIGTMTKVENGYIEFSKINQMIPHLVYGISHLAQHTFVFESKEYQLYQALKNDTAVQIKIKSIPLWQHFLLLIKRNAFLS